MRLCSPVDRGEIFNLKRRNICISLPDIERIPFRDVLHGIQPHIDML